MPDFESAEFKTYHYPNVVGEIKSTTGTVKLTNQLSDLLDYAGKNDATLRLYLTPEAKLSDSLRTRLIKAHARGIRRGRKENCPKTA